MGDGALQPNVPPAEAGDPGDDGDPGDPGDLLGFAADLVAIPSVSLQESAIADHVEALLRKNPRLQVTRIGDNVVARSLLGRDRRLVLAGHLDTVPANGNDKPLLDGDILSGLGSADMKGGLAVMLALAAGVGSPAVDVTYVFYAAEEVARKHSGLLQIEAADPELLYGDAAVLGEPTLAKIEAGCQGVLKLAITLAGTRAHTARPWMGLNAIHRLAPILGLIASSESQPRRPVIDGCEYHEALQAVAVAGGVAGNVVPDRVTLELNHRFAPDRTAEEAEAAVRELLSPALDFSAGDTIEVLESQPGAKPGLDHPLLARLVEATGAPPKAKLGWTDVAFFAERGVPAVNFGPGDPELAHTAGERVARRELESTHAALFRLLTTTT